MATHKSHKSCSNCRRRKIKCDKSEKLQGAAEGEEVVCSPCNAAKIRCENEIVQPRRTNGKRLREIRQEQGLEDSNQNGSGNKAMRTIGNGPASTSSSLSNASSLLDSFDSPSTSSHSIPTSQLSVFDETLSIPNFSPSSTFHSNRALELKSSSPFQTQPIQHQGLLGVQGLTRPLLEACITQFFISVSPTQPICRPDHFYPRYQAFLANQPSTAQSSSSSTLTSLSGSPTNSELSILAVACIGAGHLDLRSSTSDGVVENELKRKFELREALHRALKVKLHANGGEMIKKDPLDAIEACYLMYSIESDLTQDGLLQSENPDNHETGDSVLSIKPTTLSGVVKLLYDYGLNRKPNPNLSVTDKLRHTRIFWACLIADSFYSLATRKQLLVAEDSFDVDLPKWIPPPSDVHVPGVPESNPSIQAYDHVWSSQQRFEMQWVASVLRLSFIARDLNRPFVSTRAQSRGIHSAEILKAIDLMKRWWIERPKDLIFEVENEQKNFPIDDLKDNLIWRKRMKAFYLECLFHAVVFSIYFSLNDFGFFNPQDQNPVETLAQTASQMESKQKLEELTLETYHRLISVLPTISSEGMISKSTSVVRPSALCVALFGCEKAEKLIKNGSDPSEVEKELDKVEMAIRCLATAESSKTTPALVSVAKSAVEKVREILRVREKERRGETREIREESPGWKSINRVAKDYDVEAGRLFGVGQPVEERQGSANAKSGSEESPPGWSPDDLPEFLNLDEMISSENQDSVPDWLTSFSGMSTFPFSSQGVNDIPFTDNQNFDLNSFSQSQQMGAGGGGCSVNWNENLDDALSWVLNSS